MKVCKAWKNFPHIVFLKYYLFGVNLKAKIDNECRVHQNINIEYNETKLIAIEFARKVCFHVK